MAKKYGFFNSKNGDRKYNADDLDMVTKKLVSNSGVLSNPATNLQVIAGSNMSVIIKGGFAIVDNKYFEMDADEEIQIESADVILDRIDTIVLRKDINTRDVDYVYKVGAPAVNPIRKELERNNTAYEILLCEIYVRKQATQISQSDITDTRLDTNVCGVITGLISQVDTSELYTQYETAYGEDRIKNQAEFDTWFNNVKDTLLKSTLVRSYESVYISTGEEETVIPINLNNYNKDLDILNVYINGFKLIPSTDFIITSNEQITLTKGIYPNTPVNFQIFKCVDGAEAETIVTEVADHETRITALENI